MKIVGHKSESNRVQEWEQQGVIVRHNNECNKVAQQGNKANQQSKKTTKTTMLKEKNNNFLKIRTKMHNEHET